MKMWQRECHQVVAIVLTLAVAACSDATITAPPSAADAVSAASGRAARLASVGWNARTRALVVEHRTDPPMASRIYALLSVSQYEASRASAARALAGRGHGASPSLPSEGAAIAAASAAALADAYPGQAAALDRDLRSDREAMIASGESAPAIDAGMEIGRQAAARTLARIRTDGAEDPWQGIAPAGEGTWFSSTGTPPLRPLWGEVRPWLMRAGNQFRPAPPPAFGSAEYREALAEVRRISDTRTTEQLRIARFWADGAGTATPPGHWNEIAEELIARYALNERRATRVLAMLNMALMDAGISCWDAKFTYWLIRPSQADAAITTPVGLPNFPSYTSGHATFSGAASTVLAHEFPAEARRLHAMAEEAALSRLYGGIHYGFDNEQGLAAGRAIGALAIERARGESWSALQ
jgi:membrane-associated phospholipid phosphatase